MTNRYRHTDWLLFRQQVISFDSNRCVRCHRSPADGAVLQVHHKTYVSGRMPWEYAIVDCETLCKGCHAGEHGHIMPRTGWHLVASDDLGDLVGECELCSTGLRYIFAISHPKWGSMAVGTDCCDKLTDTTEASEYMDRYLKRRDRKARFVESPRWKRRADGATALARKGSTFRIEPNGTAYQIAVNGKAGRMKFESVIDARKHLFEIIESGEADEFIHKQRLKREQALMDGRRFALGAFGAFAT